MEDIRKYGSPPYMAAVVHGGPGAQGGMTEVAVRLSAYGGVLEPVQKNATIDGEIDELHQLITASSTAPVVLIGHSWGAWLSILTAARFPQSVSKLILVSSAPFEEKYAEHIDTTRMSRLTPDERTEFNSIIRNFTSGATTSPDDAGKKLSLLALKSDSYDVIESIAEADNTTIDMDIFRSVWSEAYKLRGSGKLLETAATVRCPVVAIHGDYDPHPADGVRTPLSAIIKDFRFILIEKCGHYPWKERYSSQIFYDILKSEIQM